MTCPRLFRPHANLSDEVNRNIVRSEIEGGVFLKDLPPATVLQIQPLLHRSASGRQQRAYFRASTVLPATSFGGNPTLGFHIPAA
jgi:hypothetical protein